MTNEEAITKLTNIMHDDHYSWHPSILTAFGMAVDALKGADGDLISRTTAIEAMATTLWHYPTECYKNLNEYEFAKGLAELGLKSVPSAQPEQRWIPATEKLPEDEYVLISKKPTEISGDKWSVAIAIRTADPRSRKIQWRDSGFGIIQDDEVLAWMPLPEPYKGEGENQ